MTDHFRNRDDDAGFTLIELLVVIIIIGILAAIAIPVFLNQRSRAADAQARSDLRNLANFEEIYLSDYGTYGTGAQVVAAEPKITHSSQVTSLRVVSFTSGAGYCLAATTQYGKTLYYDSEAGGLLAGSSGCSTTYLTQDGTPLP